MANKLVKMFEKMKESKFPFETVEVQT